MNLIKNSLKYSGIFALNVLVLCIPIWLVASAIQGTPNPAHWGELASALSILLLLVGAILSSVFTMTEE
jgi:hypothetical protein